jgi:hypothetical protein
VAGTASGSGAVALNNLALIRRSVAQFLGVWNTMGSTVNGQINRVNLLDDDLLSSMDLDLQNKLDRVEEVLSEDAVAVIRLNSRIQGVAARFENRTTALGQRMSEVQAGRKNLSDYFEWFSATADHVVSGFTVDTSARVQRSTTAVDGYLTRLNASLEQMASKFLSDFGPDRPSFLQISAQRHRADDISQVVNLASQYLNDQRGALQSAVSINLAFKNINMAQTACLDPLTKYQGDENSQKREAAKFDCRRARLVNFVFLTFP